MSFNPVICIFVLLAAFFVLYVYPRVVFSFFCKGKSGFFKIFFCCASSVCYLSFLTTFIFIVFNNNQILYFYILYLGVFAFSVIWKLIHVRWKNIAKFNYKNLIKQLVNKARGYISISVIIAIVATVLFIYPTFDYISANNRFTFSDMYTHCSWFLSLHYGQIFPDGIYPYGMHFVLFAISCCTHLYYYLIYLYFCFVQNFLMFLAFYWLCVTFFKRKINASLAVLLFSILYLSGIIGTMGQQQMVFSAVNRLFCTLPQEFGLFTVFAGAACLLEYFKSCNKLSKNKLFCQQTLEYAILLTVIIAASLTIHLYAAMLLFIVFGGMVLVLAWGTKIKALLLGLCSGLVGLVVACIPYLAYYVKVPKFEESINWGIKTLLGKKTLETITVAQSDNVGSAASSASSSSVTSDQATSSGFNLFGWIGDIYNNSIVPFFSNNLTPLFFILFLIGFAIVIYLFIRVSRSTRLNTENLEIGPFVADFGELASKKQNDKYVFRYYLCPFVSLFLLYLFYAAPVLGLPSITESYRFVVVIYFFIVICLFAAVDFLSFIFQLRKKRIDS